MAERRRGGIPDKPVQDGRGNREQEKPDMDASDIGAASADAAIRAQHKRSIREGWWPAVDDEESARKTARYGFWAAAINVVLTGFLIAMLLTGNAKTSLAGEPYLIWWAIGDMVVFIGVAVGLYRYSRVAAVAGLFLFIGSKAVGWIMVSQSPQVGALLIAALFLIFYIHGVRGTFAWHRHRRSH